MDDEKLMVVLEHFLSLHEADEIFSMLHNSSISKDDLESKLWSFQYEK